MCVCTLAPQWLLLLIPACLAHGAMAVYGVMLINKMYAIADRRIKEVSSLLCITAGRVGAHCALWEGV